MEQPTIRFRALRPAVANDGATKLDLLVSVKAPELPPNQATAQRPALNLSLVIDRSGSMHGSKLSNAKQAAKFLVGELGANDRLSIVTFDERVNVVVPSQPVTDPLVFLSAISTIKSGGYTDLYQGWVEGAHQVAEFVNPAGVNRVLLLSDGEANEGLTSHVEIGQKVAGLNARGISTSAFGIGEGFDEDLMGAVASGGDGTLAHIENPDQLADLYASELRGLVATAGRRVSFNVQPKNGAAVSDVLNDLPVLKGGEYQLPNLRYGQELNIGLRLTLPAWEPNQHILSLQLGWDDPGATERQMLEQSLIMPIMAGAELLAMEPDGVVAEKFALLKANRTRRLAIAEMDKGNDQGATAYMAKCDAELALLDQTDDVVMERKLLAEKRKMIGKNRNMTRKRLSKESLRSSTNVWNKEDADSGQ
ncbi:VWA domain-containing protein [Cyanobium sp. Morenito 9A2]|uniref:vWA domain-containing protein n=1 Tax=Cyanobium sp. Morenito 9A2 TaxID=2823718 RepID=UPI0020CF66D9|nr:VWA domain-containing protein [Cyanobium sp. Morenito 9A2]MCP9851018.1 VWA domain-containing protein [Cyanobium sp. Morenito 9A2]